MRFGVWKGRLRAVCLALATACGVLWSAAPTLAQCNFLATNQTCTNPAATTISGLIGIQDTATLTVTNFGTISGGLLGIDALTANVSNSGIISGGSAGVLANDTANVTNSGTISGGSNGLVATTAAVTNSGTISGGTFAGIESTTATVTNSGTISGGTLGIIATTVNVTNSGNISGGSFGIQAFNTANISNSGTIAGGTLDGIIAATANVTNSGNISGGRFGINAAANVTNSGTILGGSDGIFATGASGTANVTNSGTISGTGAGGTGIAVTTASVINSGDISGGSFGINAITATVTSSGTILGGTVGINAITANVTNSGIISGSTFGIEAFTANVTNSGKISGSTFGIDALTATVTNSGTISGGTVGIDALTANVTNSGTISGSTGIVANAPSTLVNSGAIIGTGGTAINFTFSNADALTFLPGSRIEGLIDLGAGDTVTFGTGNWLYSFGGPNAPSTATINTGGAPFVVVGNRIAVLDPTAFGLADKTLMDFTGAISGIMGSLGPTTPGRRGSAPLAFAPADSGIEAQVDDAFAAIPALAYANDGVVFKNPSVVTDDGRSVWARGFVGERVQQADGASQHATNQYAGGAVGADLLARPDLRFGVFVGGGESRLAVDPNLEQTNTNTGFGGVYGRYVFTSFAAQSFLDFALHGGASTNANTRVINNNLALNGIEIATANYNSSYLSPELKYGVNLPVWTDYILTPSMRVRYVAGFFGGYSETGSPADLTVNSRTTQDIEERGELNLTHVTSFTPADQLLTSIYGGVLGLERVGDTTVNTVLLGANLPFITPGENDVAGALGGLGFEWRTHGGVSFFGAGEYQAMSDKSSDIAAKGGVRVAF